MAKWILAAMGRYLRSKLSCCLPLDLICRTNKSDHSNNVFNLSQVQGQHISPIEAVALPGALSGRKGSYEAPSGGQEGKSSVMDLYRGETYYSRQCMLYYKEV